MVQGLRDAFGTLWIDPIGASEANVEALFNDYKLRQTAIQDCIEGTVDTDYLLDLLAEHCIEPSEYVDEIYDFVEEAL
jgi:hypothetical protein